MNANRPTRRHIITEMVKLKIQCSTSSKRERVNHKRSLIKLSGDFSVKILQARRECHYIFKVLTGKNLKSRIVYQKNEEFLRQARTKRVHQEISLMRNVKGAAKQKRKGYNYK